MNKKELMDNAKKLKIAMGSKREKVYATYKELILLLICHKKGNYKPMLKTKLYNKYGGEYCEYLSILN